MGWQDDPIASPPSAPQPRLPKWADDPVVSPGRGAEPSADGVPEITIRPQAVEDRMRMFGPKGMADVASDPATFAPKPEKSPATMRDVTGVPPPVAALSDLWNSYSAETEKPEDKGAGHTLMQGHIDAEAANIQGAGNIVRDRKGNYVRKVIGDIEVYDAGPMIRTPDGQFYHFNPKTDVMFRDPTTGKMVAFERDKDIDNPGMLARLWNIVAPGMATVAPTRMASVDAIPMATQRGAALGFPVSAKTAQTGERMKDAAAFNELGIDPFAPAFRSKGAARFARTVEEMPLIGGIVKSPKVETETALKEAQQRIAEGLRAPGTDEQAGRVLQQGLERFKGAGIRDLEPGILASRGIEPREPVQPRALMTRAAEERAAEAQPVRESLNGGVARTTRGVQVPAARPLDQAIIARRGPDSLSDAELDTIIRTASRETSFAARQEALFEKAWRSIPERFRIDASRNPERLQAVNTRAALGDVDAQIGSQIAGQSAIRGDLADRIRNARSHFDMNELRAMRTEIGRALGSLDPHQTRLNSQQLKQLYGAVSRDIEIGLQDIANRAYLQTRVSGNRPDQVAVDAARGADQALRDFRVADRYTRMGMDRIEKFTRIVGANSPEAAMRTLATRVKEGTIDRGLIRSVRDALRPEEREQILGYLVARMGEGRAGAKEAESIWNIHAFATDWNRNKDALHLLMEGAPPQVRRKLDALAQISERMKYYETTKNYSGSAYSGIPIISAVTTLASGSGVGVAAMIGQVGGMAALGKFLTNPQYLNWMVRAARTGEIEMARGPQVAGSRWPVLASQLERIAANDNELGPAVLSALRAVNADRVDGEREKGQVRERP